MYHEPWGSALGGAEVVSATLAHAFRDRGEVTLLHHNPALAAITTAELATFAGVDLDGVTIRAVPRPADKWFPADAPAWRLGREMRRWMAELSAGSDLFIMSGHGVPPFCHAERGALYVQFPAFDRRAAWPWNVPAAGGWGGLKNRLRHGLYERLWQERMASYAVRVGNSRFTREWCERYWGSDWGVLYPPVRTDFPTRPKCDAVVVLGRFTRRKQQLDAVRVFRDRVAPHAPGWELVCVGSVGKDAEDREYYREVETAAASAPIRLVADASAEQLREELARAKVFWHPAGIGRPADVDPFQLEHFGIATAEAMAAGCVPVVADRGGQPDIVTHGESGFLCANLDALADHTLRLVGDESLRMRFAEAARTRAMFFSRERFIQNARTLFSGSPSGAAARST